MQIQHLALHLQPAQPGLATETDVQTYQVGLDVRAADENWVTHEALVHVVSLDCIS